MISVLRHGKYKTSLDVTESKEVKIKGQVKRIHESAQKDSHWSNLGQFDHQNKY